MPEHIEKICIKMIFFGSAIVAAVVGRSLFSLTGITNVLFLASLYERTGRVIALNLALALGLVKC